MLRPYPYRLCSCHGGMMAPHDFEGVSGQIPGALAAFSTSIIVLRAIHFEFSFNYNYLRETLEFFVGCC
jgi:hypothetical protein